MTGGENNNFQMANDVLLPQGTVPEEKETNFQVEENNTPDEVNDRKRRRSDIFPTSTSIMELPATDLVPALDQEGTNANDQLPIDFPMRLKSLEAETAKTLRTFQMITRIFERPLVRIIVGRLNDSQKLFKADSKYKLSEEDLESAPQLFFLLKKMEEVVVELHIPVKRRMDFLAERHSLICNQLGRILWHLDAITIRFPQLSVANLNKDAADIIQGKHVDEILPKSTGNTPQTIQRYCAESIVDEHTVERKYMARGKRILKNKSIWQEEKGY